RGIEPWIVSGDAQSTTRAIAREAGIQHFVGEALPRQKADLIRELKRKGRCVGMVGDGINDGAALAEADLGFSLGAGAQILREASDFTILASDPAKVIQALDVSDLAVKAIRQNLFFAFLYNLIGIPLAIAGYLNPLIAVVAMFASSASVTGNALRIARKKIPAPPL
ncbi:MAG TPA: HAD-IC family P-type ATPase, partial [Thermodesulfobacteriota bacterium]|nr:HAD-IC family P-type ATPase [Thermodesulfobacteriota bacterium]